MNAPSKKFFVWKEEYSVGITKIDNQHISLFELINELHSAFVSKQSDNILDHIFDELFEYAKIHFSTEERYFEECNYEDKEHHVYEHREFVEKIKKMRKDANSIRMAVTYQLINFLRNWLIDHILYEDQNYKGYIKKIN